MLKGLCHSETLVVEHQDTVAVYGSSNYALANHILKSRSEMT